MPAVATSASWLDRATARPTRCSSIEASGAAFVGDHLLAKISSNTEIVPAAEPTGSRPRARIEYLGNLRRTARCRSSGCFPDTGRPVTDHSAFVRRASASTGGGASESSPSSSEGRRTRSRSRGTCGRARTVREQPLLVVWEVLGHLDLLLDDGRVSETFDDGGR